MTLFALKTDISTFLTKSSGHVARIKHFGRSKPLLKKTTFRSLKSFFLICNWKGLRLQWRSAQLEKAPEKLSACSQECLEGEKKQLFGAWKVVFLNLQFGRVSLCSGP